MTPSPCWTFPRSVWTTPRQVVKIAAMMATGLDILRTIDDVAFILDTDADGVRLRVIEKLK